MAEIFETNENKKQGTTRIFPIFRLQQTLVDIIRCHSHRKKIHKVQSHMWIYCKPHLHGRLFCVRFFDKNGSGKVAFTQRRF